MGLLLLLLLLSVFTASSGEGELFSLSPICFYYFFILQGLILFHLGISLCTLFSLIDRYTHTQMFGSLLIISVFFPFRCMFFF